MKTPHDQKLTRCPKLGDEMTFSYCCEEAGQMPCARIVTCWQGAFDVAALLAENLSPDQWERFTSAAPRNKVASLIELIEKAKRQR